MLSNWCLFDILIPCNFSMVSNFVWILCYHLFRCLVMVITCVLFNYRLPWSHNCYLVVLFIMQCCSPLRACSCSKWQGIVYWSAFCYPIDYNNFFFQKHKWKICEARVQTFEDGDMALLDMGAEYNFYGSDITCSFPVSIDISVRSWS